MTTRQILTLFLCSFLPLSLLSQNPGIYHETLDINQVKARLYNSSDMFWDLSNSPQYEVPVNSGNHSAFASSIWIGGLDQNGTLHTAAQTYRQTGNDFFTGPYRSTGNYADGLSFRPTGNANQVLGLSSNKVVYVGNTSMEIFDVATQTTMTYSYGNTRLYGRIIELVNGNILLYGDANFPNQLPLLEIDPNTLAITPTATLSNWQGLASATVLNNGQVLFAGIQGSDLYDPTTQTSTPVAGMTTLRIRSSTIVLPNGNVLATGGSTSINGSSGLNSTEIFDPITNAWTVGPAMSANRADHSMIEMSNGQILIVGGSGASGLVDHFDPNTSTISNPANLQYLFRESVLANQPNGNVLISATPTGTTGIPLFSYTPGQSAVQLSNIAGPQGPGTVLPNGNVFLEFLDGTFREIDSETLLPDNERWQHIWKVNRSEVDQFIQDFGNNAVNFANYPVIEDWPAHGDVTKGEDYYQAPFVDLDMDGVYDPAGDGDYPCIEGDQALWWTFNDDAGFHTETSGDKFGLQIKTMAYGYDCTGPCPTPWLDHSTFYNYTIQNKSGNVYSDVYFTFWMDTDIGDPFNDYVGCDTALGLGFGFNGTPTDNDYGSNPPALGTMFLDGPLTSNFTNFMYYQNSFSIQGNPGTAQEFYNLQRSIWLDGTPLTEGGNGYGGTVNTTYMFPGDPGFCGGGSTGWSEFSESNQPFDRRYLQSIGPFDLSPGEIVKFDLAVLWAQGNNNLESVCLLKDAANNLKNWFAAQNTDCLSLVVNNDDLEASSVQEGQMVLYPNPSSGDVMLEIEEALLQSGTVQVFDQTGRLVLEKEMGLGQHQLQLETNTLPNGVYIVRLNEADLVRTSKLVVSH